MFQWKVFIHQKFGRRPLARTKAESIIDFVLAPVDRERENFS